MDDASSGCSSLSARTQGSSMSIGATSTGSYRSRTLPRPPRATSTGGGGGVEEDDFQKAFADTPAVTVSLYHVTGSRDCHVTGTVLLHVSSCIPAMTWIRSCPESSPPW